MKINVNGSKSDLSAMLVSAERYALGRQTYIVEWTCDFLSKNLHLLLEKDKKNHDKRYKTTRTIWLWSMV